MTMFFGFLTIMLSGVVLVKPESKSSEVLLAVASLSVIACLFFSFL